MAKKQKSVMSSGKHFSQVPHANIQRSKFDRSHGHKTTFDAGYLVPFFVDEVLPGDTFNLNATLFARLATPIKPIMDNMFLETFFFTVPNRLIWDDWQKFNGEQDNPGDSTDFTIPQTVPGTLIPANDHKLYDHFGWPTNVVVSGSALFARAYKLIWNDWFRDENLQDSVLVEKDAGPDDSLQNGLFKRGKRHDYFTSCLPWPQKGNSVQVPIFGGATVPVLPESATATPLFGLGNEGSVNLEKIGDSTSVYYSNTDGTTDNSALQWQDPALVADFTNVSGITINSLRESFQIQKMYERDARGGTRYTEIIKSHFGVTSPDSRLQRPEYLGGGSTNINVTAVAQTNSDDLGSTPQGNLAAFGTAVSNRNGFTKSFTEHSIVIGMLCVRADLTYQQGLNRMFSRETRFDYYWPSLSHLGEQEVLNKEIFAQGTVADDDVFGYQERYAEYRYKPSQITGKFRSNDPLSLDYWHLSQDFENLPALNNIFIVEDPPIARVIAVDTEPHFLLDSYIDLKCVRPMPTYAVPGMIDHF